MKTHKLTVMVVAVFLALLVLPAFARSIHKVPIAELEFNGHYRAAAKTSYVPGPTEQCLSLSEVMDTLLADERMREKYPELSNKKTALTTRVDQEQRNVCVHGYLYAVKLERHRHGDNDIHIILGSHISGKARFLTAEVSGVPRTGDKTPFIKVRQQLLKILGRHKLHSGYTRIKKPIKIRVTGSLFFDADHVAGQVGPKYAKPRTVWEIHPVKTIEKIQRKIKTARARSK